MKILPKGNATRRHDMSYTKRSLNVVEQIRRGPNGLRTNLELVDRGSYSVSDWYEERVHSDPKTMTSTASQRFDN